MKLALALLAVLTSCASSGNHRSTAPRSTGEQELRAADTNFAKDVAARGLDAWIEAFDEHGSQTDDELRPITGHGAIRAHMRGYFADPANELQWEPDIVHVSERGNMGSTSGRYAV